MTRPANRSDRPPADVKAGILEYALELGFDTAGVSRTDDLEVAGERFRNFLALGRHGDMAWLAEKSDRRARPKNLWPDVKSVVVVGMNYGPEGDPLEVLAKPQLGALSVYAQGRDYHDVVKKRLKRLARWMVQTYGGDVKVFVDTAPVLEKPLAASAGLGWQGKHTNLVSRSFGSWLFLGSVFTTIDLAPDAAEGDHCGDCRACLDVCPTDAFPAPYQLDARRCISYLTIEHKGHIPPDLRGAIGNRVFGCDDCL
ncbi:MAG: tRNA epoxyqueuosine(34) reductase QueG, partial [Rhodospirillales bacterium]|nr:tRNA epoxyqueuosine(34) reductase QueG [Rhodospirillales bacterium]